MSNWLVAAILGLGILLSTGLAFGANADDNQPSPTRVYGMTSGRLWATIDAVAGLISVIMAGRSLARSAASAGTGGNKGATVAMVLGLIVVAYAALHLTMFTGDFGTGGGRAGAFVAMGLGVIGILLSGIALWRSRRTGSA